MNKSYIITFWNGSSVEYERCKDVAEVITFLNKNKDDIDVLSVKKDAWKSEEECKPKKITPQMIGKAMGMNPQAIRVGMQQGVLDLGECFKQSGSNYTYLIYPEKARQYMGNTAYTKMMQGEERLEDAV